MGNKSPLGVLGATADSTSSSSGAGGGGGGGSGSGLYDGAINGRKTLAPIMNRSKSLSFTSLNRGMYSFLFQFIIPFSCTHLYIFCFVKKSNSRARNFGHALCVSITCLSIIHKH